VTKFVGLTPTAAGVLHLPRAGSDAPSTTPTMSSISGTTTTKPFFPDPSTVTPSPTPASGPGQVDNGLAKSVLEYAILAVGVMIIGSIVLQRFVRLRRHNEPLSRFFSLSSHPGIFSSSSSHPFTHPLRFPRTTGLSDVPPYPYAYRTRAYDTDAAGRRLGGLQTSDHDGYIGDKDVLPAYDNAGGPPKYGELEMLSMPTTNSSFGAGTQTVPGAATDRGVGTGTGTDAASSQTAVGGAESGIQDLSVAESCSQAHPPSGRRSPHTDTERGEVIAAPAPVHMRQHPTT